MNLINTEPVLNYINNLIYKLDALYSSYPNWISYEKYIEIGKIFFSIFDEFEIKLWDEKDSSFTYAAHNELAHDLSPEQIEQLKTYADFLRNQK